MHFKTAVTVALASGAVAAPLEQDMARGSTTEAQNTANAKDSKNTLFPLLPTLLGGYGYGGGYASPAYTTPVYRRGSAESETEAAAHEKAAKDLLYPILKPLFTSYGGGYGGGYAAPSYGLYRRDATKQAALSEADIKTVQDTIYPLIAPILGGYGGGSGGGYGGGYSNGYTGGVLYRRGASKQAALSEADIKAAQDTLYPILGPLFAGYGGGYGGGYSNGYSNGYNGGLLYRRGATKQAAPSEADIKAAQDTLYPILGPIITGYGGYSGYDGYDGYSNGYSFYRRDGEQAHAEDKVMEKNTMAEETVANQEE